MNAGLAELRPCISLLMKEFNGYKGPERIKWVADTRRQQRKEDGTDIGEGGRKEIFFFLSFFSGFPKQILLPDCLPRSLLFFSGQPPLRLYWTGQHTALSLQ